MCLMRRLHSHYEQGSLVGDFRKLLGDLLREVNNNLSGVYALPEVQEELTKIRGSLNIEILRADEFEARRVWSRARMEGRGKMGGPEKTRLRAAVCPATTASVKYRSILSDSFEMKTGVRQGNGLSPILFSLVLDQVVKQWRQLIKAMEIEGVHIGYKIKHDLIVNRLAFANYMALLNEKEQDAKMALKSDGWVSLRHGYLDNLKNMTRDGDSVVQMERQTARATAYVYFTEMPPTRVIEVSMGWRRDEGVGGNGRSSRKPADATSSGTIHTCENLGVSRPGIESGSPCWVIIRAPVPQRSCNDLTTYDDSVATPYCKGERANGRSTRKPADQRTSSGTIATGETPGGDRLGSELGSPLGEASCPTAQPPRSNEICRHSELLFSYTVTTDSTTYPNVSGHVIGELCSISGKLVVAADLENTAAVRARVESFHLESPTVSNLIVTKRRVHYEQAGDWEVIICTREPQRRTADSPSGTSVLYNAHIRRPPILYTPVYRKVEPSTRNSSKRKLGNQPKVVLRPQRKCECPARKKDTHGCLESPFDIFDISPFDTDEADIVTASRYHNITITTQRTRRGEAVIRPTVVIENIFTDNGMLTSNYTTTKPGNDFSSDLSTAFHEMLKTETTPYLQNRMANVIKAAASRVTFKMMPITTTTRSSPPTTTTRIGTVPSIKGSTVSSPTTSKETGSSAATPSKQNIGSTSAPCRTTNSTSSEGSINVPSTSSIGGSPLSSEETTVITSTPGKLASFITVTPNKGHTSTKQSRRKSTHATHDHTSESSGKGKAFPGPVKSKETDNGGQTSSRVILSDVLSSSDDSNSGVPAGKFSPRIVITLSPGAGSEYPPHTHIKCDITPSNVPYRRRETAQIESDPSNKKWLTENFNRFFDLLLEETDRHFTSRRSGFLSLPDDEEEIYVARFQQLVHISHLSSDELGIFSQVGIVPDDAVCRRVFSGISHFSQPLHSGATPYSLQSSSSALRTSLLRATWYYLLPFPPYGRGGVVVRLLAFHQGETGFDSRRRRLRIFACGNRAGRCHWSAGFFRGDLPFPPLLHPGAAPCSPRFTPIGSQDLNIKSSQNLFTSLLAPPPFCRDNASRLLTRNDGPVTLTDGVVYGLDRIALEGDPSMERHGALANATVRIGLSNATVSTSEHLHAVFRRPGGAIIDELSTCLEIYAKFEVTVNGLWYHLPIRISHTPLRPSGYALRYLDLDKRKSVWQSHFSSVAWANLELKLTKPMWVIDMRKEQRRNGGAGETGDPREGPSINGIQKQDVREPFAGEWNGVRKLDRFERAADHSRQLDGRVGREGCGGQLPTAANCKTRRPVVSFERDTVGNRTRLALVRGEPRPLHRRQVRDSVLEARGEDTCHFRLHPQSIVANHPGMMKLKNVQLLVFKVIQGHGVKVMVMGFQYDGWEMHTKMVVAYQDGGLQ
ncbi:hypothetical protein PR048_027022 [Dryococelus australis]|uniref:Reverse transcriptase domain-containing protein n=1 Tax=Dryococelus australis TaxID=614101 RepID=A0ABQ9GMX9_9NEOP|nr:hypothetical protein PR048_027022 [Dryococelus australis]